MLASITEQAFASLADLSEGVLLGSVVELARRRDLKSIDAFLHFVDSLPDMRRYPLLCTNRSIPVPIRSSEGEASDDIVCGYETSTAHCFTDALASGFSNRRVSGPAMSGDVEQEDKLTPAELDSIKRILSVGEAFPDPTGWRHRFAQDLCQRCNSHALPALLASFGVTFERDEFAGAGSPGVQRRFKSLAEDALEAGNLHFAAEALRQMPKLDLEESLKCVVSGPARFQPSVKMVARALEEDPAGVTRILEALGSCAEAATFGNFLGSVLYAYLDEKRRASARIDDHLVDELILSSAANEAALQELLATRQVLSDNLLNTIVATHTASLLHLAAERLRVLIPTSAGLVQTGIARAIDGNSAHIGETSDASRLKQTLEQLVELGHDVNDVEGGKGALAVLEAHYSQEHVHKLRVLLELGADPEQLSRSGRKPGDVLRGDDQVHWQTVVRTFRTYQAGQRVLATMKGNELGAAP